MKKINFKDTILKRKFSIPIIIVLLIIIGVLFVQRQDYKYTLFHQYQTVPDIELKNTLFKKRGVFVGEVSGFVKFDNLKDQPKKMRQYYIIKPLNKFDKNQSQYFSVDEIVKMPYLSPRSLGTSSLIEINKNTAITTLEDQNGNQFFINNSTGKISMKDNTGDSTILITSDSDYKDFMESWLLK